LNSIALAHAEETGTYLVLWLLLEGADAFLQLLRRHAEQRWGVGERSNVQGGELSRMARYGGRLPRASAHKPVRSAISHRNLRGYRLKPGTGVVFARVHGFIKHFIVCSMGLGAGLHVTNGRASRRWREKRPFPTPNRTCDLFENGLETAGRGWIPALVWV